MKKNEYKCAMCGEINTKGWRDEEAHKEATEIFGAPPEDWKTGQAIVCDDCFQKIHPLKIENTGILLDSIAQNKL